jgi:hypothetical protein
MLSNARCLRRHPHAAERSEALEGWRPASVFEARKRAPQDAFAKVQFVFFARPSVSITLRSESVISTTNFL